jgi:uncharacterized caspase-like protein
VYLFFSGMALALPFSAEGYIFASDSLLDRPASTAVRLSDVSRLIKASYSRRIFLFADLCRGATALNSQPNYITPALLRMPKGAQVSGILASAPEQPSFEDDRLSHGVFTYFLLQGLHGKADFDRDGYMSLTELNRFVSAQVNTYTHGKQEPVSFGDLKSRWPASPVGDLK